MRAEGEQEERDKTGKRGMAEREERGRRERGS